ncbi:major facilitator superfamily domain-containing protein 6-B-like [Penaeus japonicus]|uniref:major facilitator superfamily domain-containing protein 6-B-like n=1 Tax=Penaeus japonicus TaxID=27405 RepID=UPI001C713E9F|nr:major facilitator superfamily domain-containing protein 6-B-like [Penaeus japonicus]XP_042856326.1 major facilitator superfamily domain-containing protein 6-B-like [Penaeus japonicus]XP_042856327.1 major facilitator superfamily domain-containing protein 6-B-like [Penaeus japonicus]
MSTRRHLSWRARQGSQRFKDGSRRAAVTCWGDFINPRLVPIKITFFLIMGATQCVAPFTTLLLKALGLTVQETGFIYTIGPLIPVIAPFIAGVIADKVGNFRGILVITVALSGFVALMNVGIPPARTTPTYSDKLSLSVTCDTGFVLTPIKPKRNIADCIFYNQTVTIPNVSARKCGYLCSDPAVEYPPLILRKVKKVQVMQTFNSTLYHMCELQYGKNSQKCFRMNLNKSRSYENMPKFFQIHNLVLHLSAIDPENPFIPVDNFTMSSREVRSFECSAGRVPKKVMIPKIIISDEEEEKLPTVPKSVECRFHCEANIPHNLTCEENELSIEHNVALSFWLFVTANVLSKFFIGLTYTLFEVAVVAILKEYGYDYGLQRIYGSIGGMVFAPLSGFFIDHFGQGEHYTDYYVMFVFYCVLKIVCAVILVKVDLRFKVPARSICNNMSNIFSNLEILFLIGIVFIAGMCYGFIEHFLPWHLGELGASNWFIGLLTSVASISALPFLAFSGAISKKFGNIQSISFGLVCYSIRCIGYSLIQDYYWCVPFETLEGITTGLLVATTIIYGAQLSCDTNVATVQGILAAFHYGFGKSIGSLLGGFLMENLEPKFAFQIFSGISLTSGFCYYLLGKLIILPRQARMLKQRQEVMNMSITTISRKEHKKMSNADLQTAISASKKDEFKRRDKYPPAGKLSPHLANTSEAESERKNETDTKETEVLDETQMTDLPPDDTMLSFDESFADIDETQPKEGK